MIHHRLVPFFLPLPFFVPVTVLEAQEAKPLRTWNPTLVVGQPLPPSFLDGLKHPDIGHLRAVFHLRLGADPFRLLEFDRFPLPLVSKQEPRS